MSNVTEIYRSKAHRHYCINKLAERRAASMAMSTADALVEKEKTDAAFDDAVEDTRSGFEKAFDALLADAQKEARDERS